MGDKIFGNMVDTERQREFWVKKHLEDIPAGQTILDCGAGEQRYRKYCKHLQYISQDFCEFDGQAIAGLDTNGEWNTSEIDIVSDIIDIPVEAESYDNVLCTEVLEHIKHPELAIKEFFRVLKGEGHLILTIPFASYTHMAPYHYCSGFDKYWYQEILPEYGFKILELVPNGNYFDLVAMDLRRTPLMSKTYAKPLRLLGKITLTLSIRLLNQLSANSLGSEEFATNGYMVVAKKQIR